MVGRYSVIPLTAFTIFYNFEWKCENWNEIIDPTNAPINIQMIVYQNLAPYNYIIEHSIQTKTDKQETKFQTELDDTRGISL